MKFTRITILNLVLLLCLASAGAQENAVPKLQRGEQYKLRIQGIPSDEMASIDGLYRIDAKGGITIPFVGRIQVEGMTVKEAQKAMEDSLKNNGIYNFPRIKIVKSNEIQP